MQLLSNLFKLCWKWKNADIIFLCNRVMSKNPKYWGKLMKIANIDRDFLHIFWTTWGNSMKFSGKLCFKIIWKATKKQGSTLSVEDTFFKKPKGEVNLNHPGRQGLKFTGKHPWQSSIFNKAADLRPATVLKIGLWHWCFLVNFEKFLRIPFLQNTSGRMFLYMQRSC